MPSESLAQWLRLSLSKRPNKVGVSIPHLKKETDAVSETLCFLVVRISGNGQSPETQWFFWVLYIIVRPFSNQYYNIGFWWWLCLARNRIACGSWEHYNEPPRALKVDEFWSARPTLWYSSYSFGYRSRGPGSIPGATRCFWEVVGLERCPLSLVSTIEELL
jgi:hypothetical protein